MNERRTFLASAAAFFVGLVLGQPAKLPVIGIKRGIYRTIPIDPGPIKLRCTATIFRYDFPLEMVDVTDRGQVISLEHRDRNSHPAPAWSVNLPFRSVEEIARLKGYDVRFLGGHVAISKPRNKSTI